MFVTGTLADMAALTVLEQKRSGLFEGIFQIWKLESVEIHQFKKSVEKSVLI